MRARSRLESLRRRIDRVQRPYSPNGMAVPGNELRSLFIADRPSARIMRTVREWHQTIVADSPEVRATMDRLCAVLETRLERMRALGWPRDGLGDDPPEAHEERPPDHVMTWYWPNNCVGPPA